MTVRMARYPGGGGAFAIEVVRSEDIVPANYSIRTKWLGVESSVLEADLEKFFAGNETSQELALNHFLVLESLVQAAAFAGPFSRGKAYLDGDLAIVWIDKGEGLFSFRWHSAESIERPELTALVGYLSELVSQYPQRRLPRLDV